MRLSDYEEITDEELNQMLSSWVVTVPSDELRARVFDAAWDRVEVKNSWRPGPMVTAFLLQSAAVALAFTVFQSPLIQKKLKVVGDVTLLSPFRPHLPPAAKKSAGGGGAQSTPLAKGAAPQFVLKQFIPPTLAVPKPALPLIPTITAAAPQIEADNYGDPLSKLSGVGLGTGLGTGVGDGGGSGLGSGFGGGTGDGSYAAGGDVSMPTLLSKVEPEYSDEARKAKYSGTVLLSVVVDERGIPRDIHVLRALGLGLDEKAIAAVQKWRFRPGVRNGHPVPVRATVEVSFRLL